MQSSAEGDHNAIICSRITMQFSLEGNHNGNQLALVSNRFRGHSQTDSRYTPQIQIKLQNKTKADFIP